MRLRVPALLATAEKNLGRHGPVDPRRSAPGETKVCRYPPTVCGLVRHARATGRRARQARATSAIHPSGASLSSRLQRTAASQPPTSSYRCAPHIRDFHRHDGTQKAIRILAQRCRNTDTIRHTTERTTLDTRCVLPLLVRARSQRKILLAVEPMGIAGDRPTKQRFANKLRHSRRG